MSLHSVPQEITYPKLSSKGQEGVARFLCNYNGDFPVILTRKPFAVYYVHAASGNSPYTRDFYNYEEWAHESCNHSISFKHKFSITDIYVLNTIEDFANWKHTKEYVRE